jgi:hypothetical protein
MKWLEMVQVAGATFAAAITIVVLYSVGVRFTAVAGDPEQATPRWMKSLAFTCFTLCGLAVLFGLYLIIPNFSK